jgi:hypothetical protein
MTIAQLNRKFDKLNRQYVKLDMEMDFLAAQGKDTTEIESLLESIQQQMGEISNQIENAQT